MNSIAKMALIVGLMLSLGCKDNANDVVAKNTTINPVDSVKIVDQIVDQVVEVSCGQCQFKMQDKKGCDLAVRIDGTSYFVDGSSIDDHGDAHGDDGLCNCVRKAKVTGEIKDGRFVATAIEILPVHKN